MRQGMASLANIVREHVKFDMFSNNVAQFGHHVGQQIQVKKCSWHVCTCSKHFREHLLFDRMLSNLATMFANNSTQSGKSCGRNHLKSFKSIVTDETFRRVRKKDNRKLVIFHCNNDQDSTYTFLT